MPIEPQLLQKASHNYQLTVVKAMIAAARVDGHIDNEVRQRILNTATPTAITRTDGTLLFDTTSTAITVSLPSASIGKVRVPFKDIGANAGTNNITINRDGTDTIVTSVTGATAAVINVNGDSGYLLSNGVDTWYLFGGYQNLA